MIILKSRVENAQRKTVVGFRMKMSFSEDRTKDLLREFKARRWEITHAVSSDLILIQAAEELPDPAAVDPDHVFEKRVGIEVAGDFALPVAMEMFALPGGAYAVFNYKGLPERSGEVFRHICGTVLPEAGFAKDNRPQFELLGAKYKKGSPDSEEEIWIPVKPADEKRSLV